MSERSGDRRSGARRQKLPHTYPISPAWSHSLSAGVARPGDASWVLTHLWKQHAGTPATMSGLRPSRRLPIACACRSGTPWQSRSSSRRLGRSGSVGQSSSRCSSGASGPPSPCASSPSRRHGVTDGTTTGSAMPPNAGCAAFASVAVRHFGRAPGCCARRVLERAFLGHRVVVRRTRSRPSALADPDRVIACSGSQGSSGRSPRGIRAMPSHPRARPRRDPLITD